MSYREIEYSKLIVYASSAAASNKLLKALLEVV